MNSDLTTIWDGFLKVGSISGFLGLFYIVSQNRKKQAKFKFDFKSAGGRIIKEEKFEFYNLVFEGFVKNQSVEANSITDIDYIVWGNKTRTRSLSFGGVPRIFLLDNNITTEITLPIKFESKEAKNLRIMFNIGLTGSHDEALVKMQKPIAKGAIILTQKYEYKLTFKDINENFFDDKGDLRSLELNNLWWVLPNTFHKMKNGNLIPYIVHMIKILWAYFIYLSKRIIRFFGL